MNYAKNIILGVTGGIAAYKSADLIRRLRNANYNVRVVMTSAAKKFITPLTLHALSGHRVYDDLFDQDAELSMEHIELARWADAVMIAPASANTIAKLAHGLSDDLLSTICLATTSPIAIAPAMNEKMWGSDAVQDNIHLLQQRGVKIFGPALGSQACGDVGLGRMQEPEVIASKLEQLFKTDLLAGKTVLITAGPTLEALDPVRFIGNHSSGKMGFALAEAAREAGAEVILVAGPVELTTPKGIKRIDVTTALEMHAAVEKQNCDIFIGSAAVADYRPVETAEQKIKSGAMGMQIAMIKNPDIITDVAIRRPQPFVVGFCLETENIIENARRKLAHKHLNLIIANSVSENTGFYTDTNEVILVSEAGENTIPLASKYCVAKKIIAVLATKTKEKECLTN